MSENPFKIIRSTDQPPSDLRKEVMGSVKFMMLLMRFLQLFAADPGPAITGNAYEQTTLRERHWRDTIDHFLTSDYIARHFGPDFRHIYGQQKLREFRKFNAEVTDVEVAWYLRTL